MSIKEKLLSTIGDVLAPIIELMLKELFKTVLLKKLHDDNPRAYEVTVTSIYPPLDVYLETAVQRTDSKIDDAIVHGIMYGIEESAVEYGVTLPNLDQD